MTTTTMIMNRWYGGCGVIHAGNSARCSALRGQRAGTSSTAHMGTCRQQSQALLLVERRAFQLSDWLRQGFVIPIIRGCIPRTRHRLLDCKTSLTFLQIPQNPDNDGVALDEPSSILFINILICTIITMIMNLIVMIITQSILMTIILLKIMTLVDTLH